MFSFSKISSFTLTSKVFINLVFFRQQFRNFHYSTVYYNIIKKYTKEHEWISFNDNGVGVVGITNYAQKALGDVVFVELPEPGLAFVKGDTIGAVESVKSASDIYAPLSGQVIESNKSLLENPGLINKGAESSGWICKVKIADIQEGDDLMDIDSYKMYCDE
ncbi:glycine cleavage system H protein [Pneumocystis jirovecii RU7]|uniref:Glycine cleavage system H protein n=1 Tax=Pneumocystis jirovecii (strain RU7) TaxID=1408657 RepID=A0A0W4ZNH9_PNEJ7|nr:glycine cleavage system H protein [Pneumocystis jirovecii RU7]KTW29940.1 glycine cleavage system H protein [Pneumocystis jirovecii RU7]